MPFRMCQTGATKGTEALETAVPTSSYTVEARLMLTLPTMQAPTPSQFYQWILHFFFSFWLPCALQPSGFQFQAALS